MFVAGKVTMARERGERGGEEKERERDTLRVIFKFNDLVSAPE